MPPFILRIKRPLEVNKLRENLTFSRVMSQLTDSLVLGDLMNEIHVPLSDKTFPSKEEFVKVNNTWVFCVVFFVPLRAIEIHCLLLEKAEFEI